MSNVIDARFVLVFKFILRTDDVATLFLLLFFAFFFFGELGTLGVGLLKVIKNLAQATNGALPGESSCNWVGLNEAAVY